MDTTTLSTLLFLAGGGFLARAGWLAGRRGLDLYADEGIVNAVRVLRHVLLAVGCYVIAWARWAELESLALFGLVFLLEELYETSMVLGVLKWDASNRMTRSNGSIA